MSNDKQIATLMGNGNLPAFVQSARAQEINKEATAGTGGESINRISLKQSRFRLIVGGEQVKVFDEPYMDVVVVRTNPNISKAYYAKKYDPNAEDQAPDCYSSNGVVPDASVERKQCSNCADCPMNQWGSKISDVSGAKVKACSDIKRIAVVPHVNVGAPMFQVAVPAGSLKVWGNYVRMLNQTTPPIPYNGVVTRMSFDPDSDFPKLQFAPQSWVSEQDYEVIQQRYDSEEAKHITTTVDTPVDAAPQAEDNTAAEQAKAEAARQAEEAAKAEAARQAAEQTKKEAEAAEAAKAKQASAQTEQAKAEAAAAWGGGASQGAQSPTSDQSDPWAGAQQANANQQANPAEFEAAGWDTPEQANPAAKTKEPPAQEHVETKATVVESDDSLDSVFGAGFDD